MIKPIVRDMFFLQQKSVPAGPADASSAQDLLDTLTAHRGRCVGMAANMIGVRKRIIAVDQIGIMLNPVILRREGAYPAEEGCLSLGGTRSTTRYQLIEVAYQDAAFRSKKQVFVGWTAQIIQHECDHLDGILI